MTKDSYEKKKNVIGLYGEMQLAMALHAKGWQVHRSYIDEGIDFVITKYYCSSCLCFVNQYIKNQKYNNKVAKCVTNLCDKCHKDSIKILSNYLQVKTSEGIPTQKEDIRNFSFHPKIRYDMGDNIFYVWIAVFEDIQDINNTVVHFYVFNTKDVKKFDNIFLDTYQITDNQKTELSINKKGMVVKSGKKYDYSCFLDFYNNFDALEIVTK